MIDRQAPLRPRRAPVSWLLSALFGLVAVSPGAAQEDDLTEWQQLARDVFEELIEINTSHSVGGTLEASEAMAARLLAEGFDPADVSVTEVAPGSAAVAAR